MQEKKRVAFCVAQLLYGGTETALVRYVNNLAKERYDVTVVIANNLPGLEKRLGDIGKDVHIEYLVRDGILTSLIKKKIGRGRLSVAEKLVEEAFLAPIRKALQRRRMARLAPKLDAIVDWDYASYQLLPRKTPCRTVAFFHFSVRAFCAGRRGRMERLGKRLNRHDAIVCVSQEQEREAKSIFGFAEEKISCIYNPIDKDELERAAREYAIPRGGFLLSVARIDERQKDFTTLLEAYSKALQRSNDLPPLKILGQGPDEARMKSLARGLGICDRVDFLGFKLNPMPWIAGCTTFVLSSKYEGLSVVLTEALTLGKMIVAKDCPTGTREALDGGACGLLTPVGDAERMAEAMTRATQDGVLRQKCHENALAHRRTFSLETSLAKLEAVLR